MSSFQFISLLLNRENKKKENIFEDRYYTKTVSLNFQHRFRKVINTVPANFPAFSYIFYKCF